MEKLKFEIGVLQLSHSILSARESYTILHFFSCSVGDFIEKDYKVLKYVCTLENLVDMLLSSSFSNDDITCLKNIIHELHTQYMSLFGDTLKCKHHLVTHYPEIIKQSGPLRYLWCMRFEAKNREMKMYTNSTSSWLNLPLSLAKKCAIKFSSFLLTENQNSTTDDNIVIKINFNLNTRPCYKNALSALSIDDIVNYSAADEVKFNSTTFKINYFILYEDSVHKITDIVIRKNFNDKKTIYLVIQEQICFKSLHFNCYTIISHIPELKFVSIDCVPYKPSQLHRYT